MESGWRYLVLIARRLRWSIVGAVVSALAPTAQRADRVAVLEGGRLVEVASHEELVQRGDRYARLWASWEAGLGTAAAGA